MKTLEWWGSRGYCFEPVISFVLMNHNMSDVSKGIVDHLRQFDRTEIVALDDGSEHTQTRILLDHMVGVNEFVIHANDLFDVVMFNRVFGFARGKYIVALQDDDVLAGHEWVDRAMRAFAADPLLAVLGGRDRVSVSSAGTVQTSYDGEFQYAQIINAAPMWLRKDVFIELGGFDMEFAPMLWHEGAFCIKAWLAGYRVGWYKSGVQACAVPTHARRNAKSSIVSVSTQKNFALLMERYGNVLADVQGMVDACNRK